MEIGSKILTYLIVFASGGLLCAIAQLLIVRTKLTPARILVIFLCAGIILEAAGAFQYMRQYAQAGVTVPILGFGASLARGAIEGAQAYGFMGAYVEQGLRYGLAMKEEAKLLYGDGTNNTIHGLVPQATAYDTGMETGRTGVTIIDRTRLAMLQVMMALYPPSGIVLNPVTWADIELIKDDNGKYLLSNAHVGAEKQLWGLPVVDTMSLQSDTFLVGAFDMAAAILDRTITVATQHDTNFTTNKITVLCENRVGLMVTRPSAYVSGSTIITP